MAGVWRPHVRSNPVHVWIREAIVPIWPARSQRPGRMLAANVGRGKQEHEEEEQQQVRARMGRLGGCKWLGGDGLRLCPSICELSSELSGRTQATRRELLPEPEEPVSRVSTSRLAAPCTLPILCSSYPTSWCSLNRWPIDACPGCCTSVSACLSRPQPGRSAFFCCSGTRRFPRLDARDDTPTASMRLCPQDLSLKKPHCMVVACDSRLGFSRASSPSRTPDNSGKTPSCNEAEIRMFHSMPAATATCIRLSRIMKRRPLLLPNHLLERAWCSRSQRRPS